MSFIRHILFTSWNSEVSQGAFVKAVDSTQSVAVARISQVRDTLKVSETLDSSTCRKTLLRNKSLNRSRILFWHFFVLWSFGLCCVEIAEKIRNYSSSYRVYITKRKLFGAENRTRDLLSREPRQKWVGPQSVS